MGWMGYLPRATSLNTLFGGCTFRQPMTHILETNPSLTTACEVDVVFSLLYSAGIETGSLLRVEGSGIKKSCKHA